MRTQFSISSSSNSHSITLLRVLDEHEYLKGDFLMKVATILDQIDLGAIALPEFQRGYVWSRKQVRNFMFSLYRKHPVGSLLVWVTPSTDAPTRGDGTVQSGHVKLILDGQQRITSLYGIVKGRPPEFFDGNANAFTGLMFNLDEEVFEFYAPVKMKDNPLWISVTDLMKEGLKPYIQQFTSEPDLKEKMGDYIDKLNTITGIKDRDFHIEDVVGESTGLDEVVEIFNNVNSGGTKLSKGDLALAKVCAGWPDARNAMREVLERWKKAGYQFKLDWLLRNVTTVLTGQAMFDELEDVEPETFQRALPTTEKAVNYLLNVISGRLGLDHDRVLGGRYAFPVMSRYIVKCGGKISNAADRDGLLYWYVHTFLWGRFTGSTETILNQDLRAVEEAPTGGEIKALIQNLRRSRGDLIIRPDDFTGWSLGARFYPLLYLLTRVGEAIDWGTGIPLKEGILGKLNRLNVHHIFPKALLYGHGYTQSEVNALANFCFLTQDTNLDISNTPPSKYFPEVESAFPGALRSQWIPMDESLWKTENYLNFLEARRKLLADAANGFLNSLLASDSVEMEEVSTEVSEGEFVILGSIDTDDEQQELLLCSEWLTERGLSPGELGYELVDDEGRLIAIIDLAWPAGLQEGLSEPVAILLDEGDEIEDILNHNGYRYFTNMPMFYEYVNDEILEPVAEG